MRQIIRLQQIIVNIFHLKSTAGIRINNPVEHETSPITTRPGLRRRTECFSSIVCRHRRDKFKVCSDEWILALVVGTAFTLKSRYIH